MINDLIVGLIEFKIHVTHQEIEVAYRISLNHVFLI